MDYLGQVDFAKWVFDGDYATVMRHQATIGDIFAYENGRASYKKPSSERHGGYHDGARGVHVAWIEVSGPVAQNVVEALGWEHTAYINRLDWRVELSHPAYTYNEMYHAMKANRTKGETFTEMDSRERKKQGKRDSGGESLYSGAAGSDKRLVYYKRGDEHAAVECRALQKEAKLLIARAMSRWQSGSCATMLDCLTEQLDQYSEVLFHERTGYSWRVVTGQEQRSDQQDVFTHQENLLDKLTGLYEELTDDGRMAFLDAVLQIEGAEEDVADALRGAGKGYLLAGDSTLDE